MNDNFVREMISVRAGADATEIELDGLGLEDVKGIKHLQKLTHVNLSGNRLTSIPPELFELVNLRSLVLRGNRIAGISQDIRKLSQLEFLDLTSNDLTELPHFLSALPELKVLQVVGNPNLSAPPPEVIKLGTEPILAYLRSIEWEYEFSSKLLIVGEGGVGKTSLLKALFGLPFDPTEPTTHSLKVDTLSLSHPQDANTIMRLAAWDFGGQQIYHATHQFFFSNRSLYLLVWNARLGWEQGRLEYWLDLINAKAPDSPILVVSTHNDQRQAELPSIEFLTKYPQILRFLDVTNASALRGQPPRESPLGLRASRREKRLAEMKRQTEIEDYQKGITLLREEVRRAAARLPLMGQSWPKTWLTARDAVERLHGLYTTPERLHSIFTGCEVAAGSKNDLLQILNELGELLYFHHDEQLKEFVILRPQWLADYIGRVLDSTVVKDNNGVLTRKHMSQLWSDIDPGVRHHFLRLMEKFDLSYRTLEDEEISLVVERLSLDPPDYARRWDESLLIEGGSEVSLRYQLNSIPPGIPTWFIARSHRFTTHTHWRSGALFEKRGNTRQLGLVTMDRLKHSLQLSVRGVFPQEFFAILKDGLELTLQRYPGLQVTRYVRCRCTENCGHEWDYDHLQRRLQASPPREQIECPVSWESADVTEMLFGLRHQQPAIDVLGRIERLETTIRDDIAEARDATTAELLAMREFIAREFIQVWRREQNRLEIKCPSVFALVPQGRRLTMKKIFGSRIQLILYCEAPGHWHPAADNNHNNNGYVLKNPASWWRAIGPHIEHLLRIFKIVAPLVAPVVGIASAASHEALKHDLKLMEEVVKAFPARIDVSGDLFDEFVQASDYSAELAPIALENLLTELDPTRYWSGLRMVTTPEGDVYWLCGDHARIFLR